MSLKFKVVMSVNCFVTSVISVMGCYILVGVAALLLLLQNS